MEIVKNLGNNESISQGSQPGFDGILANGGDSPTQVPTKTEYSWFYYDNDLEVFTLTEKCLNVKGTREKQLQQALRGVRDRLKLKKVALPKPVEAQQPVEAVN